MRQNTLPTYSNATREQRNSGQFIPDSMTPITGKDWMDSTRLKSGWMSGYAPALQTVKDTTQKVWDAGWRPSQMGLSPYVWNPTNSRYERKAVADLTPDDITERWLQQRQEDVDAGNTALDVTNFTPENAIGFLQDTDIRPYEHTASWYQKNIAPYAGIALGLATLGGAAPLAGIGSLFGGGALGGAAMGAAGGLLSGAKGNDLLSAAITGGLAGGTTKAPTTATGSPMVIPSNSGLPANTPGWLSGANTVTNTAKGGGGMDFSNFLKTITGALGSQSSGGTTNDVLSLALKSYVNNPSSPLTGAAAVLGAPALQTITGDSGILNDIAQGWADNRGMNLNGKSGALWGAIGNVAENAGMAPAGGLAQDYIKGSQYGMTPQQMLIAKLTGQPIDRQLAAGLTTENWTPELLQQLGGAGSATGGGMASGGTAGQTGGLGGILQNILGGGGASGTGGGLLGGSGIQGLLAPLLMSQIGNIFNKDDNAPAPTSGAATTGLSQAQSANNFNIDAQKKDALEALRTNMMQRGLYNSGIYNENLTDLLSKIEGERTAANNASAMDWQRISMQDQQLADARSQANQDRRASTVGNLLSLFMPQGPGNIFNIGGGQGGSAGGAGATTSSLPAAGNWNTSPYNSASTTPSIFTGLAGNLLNVFKPKTTVPTTEPTTDWDMSMYNPANQNTTGRILPNWGF